VTTRPAGSLSYADRRTRTPKLRRRWTIRSGPKPAQCPTRGRATALLRCMSPEFARTCRALPSDGVSGFWGYCGPDMLAMSLSGYDPTETWAVRAKICVTKRRCAVAPSGRASAGSRGDCCHPWYRRNVPVPGGMFGAVAARARDMRSLPISAW
jgi:hypothetical protein